MMSDVKHSLFGRVAMCLICVFAITSLSYNEAAADGTEPSAAEQVTYQVQSGDSAWSIAARHQLTLEQFLALNNLPANPILQIGQRVLIAEIVPTATPTATPSPTETPTLTPTVTPSVTPTPVSGTLCLLAFEDANGNGRYDSAEPLENNVTFTLRQGERIITTYVTNGVDEPFCVPSLPGGEYHVQRTYADGKSASGEAEAWLVYAQGGELLYEAGSITQTPSPQLTRLLTVPTATPEPPANQSSMPLSNDQMWGVATIVLVTFAAIGAAVTRRNSRW